MKKALLAIAIAAALPALTACSSTPATDTGAVYERAARGDITRL